MAQRRIPTLQRVLAKIADTPGDCWLFTGCKVVGGYGQVREGKKGLYVHRVTYEAFVGPIPEGFQVDHLCRVPACCNPAHLEAVTPAVNQARTLKGARGDHRASIEKAKTHCPRNHAYDAENTYVNDKGYRWCRACRREKYHERKQAA